MRIELTIKTTYLPEWGVWEGIRELIQNARDAEVEFGAPMTVRHRAESNTLVIENDGTVLPHEALLLGFTSKAGRSDQIGKFGEGLKLGILALVRKGLTIKIRSGSEVWVPRIVRSEKFDADVLAFDILKNREAKNRVQVEVCGINTEAWEMLRGLFLFLTKVKDGHACKTAYSGTILTGPQYQGKVFVRGIHVSKNADLRYGYDLVDVDIDRDRKMIDQASLRWRLTSLWRSAVNEHPEMTPEYIQLLDDQAADLDGLDSYTAKQLSEDVRAKITEKFLARHGANALPVTNLSQSAEIEHLGMTGVVVSNNLRAVLEAQLGDVESNKKKLAFMPKHTYGWRDLSSAERESLTSAIALVNAQEPVTLADVDVVDFRADNIDGMFSSGRMSISRKILVDTSETLATLVHEVAHRAGADGEKAHVMRIEKIWSGIVAAMRSTRS
jgi:hypothetical protein